MTEALFYGVLLLVTLASAAWLLLDFSDRWRGAQRWPQRLTTGTAVPEWLRKDSGYREAPALPPMLGPARLPSFAWHTAPDADATRTSPRRTHRPRRPRTSTLRPAV